LNLKRKSVTLKREHHALQQPQHSSKFLAAARAVTQFLVQIVADGATMTSNAISQTVALKQWWR